MTIANIEQLSNAALADLLVQCTVEIKRRLVGSTEIVQVQETAPSKTLLAPANSDLRFVETMLASLRNKELIRAAEKDAYAAIQKQFPEFFRSRGWPDSLRGNNNAFIKYGRAL